MHTLINKRVVISMSVSYGLQKLELPNGRQLSTFTSMAIYMKQENCVYPKTIKIFSFWPVWPS